MKWFRRFAIVIVIAFIAVITSTPVAAVTGPQYQCQIGSCSVLVTEVAWAGTVADHYDEWFELMGNGSSSTYISGWKIQVVGGPNSTIISTIVIPYTGWIAPNQRLVFEAYSDSTIVGLAADGIWTNGTFPQRTYVDWLLLVNAQGHTVHGMHFGSRFYPAGNWFEKTTMDMKCDTSGTQWYPGFAPNDVWWSPPSYAWNSQYKDAAGFQIKGTPGYVYQAAQCAP